MFISFNLLSINLYKNSSPKLIDELYTISRLTL
nr:MAG TPA: hypothetical protein [Caudoviricetes sp.]